MNVEGPPQSFGQLPQQVGGAYNLRAVLTSGSLSSAGGAVRRTEGATKTKKAAHSRPFSKFKSPY
jgi:hypothetical protein